MKAFLIAISFVFLCLAAPSQSKAQVDRGDVRLFFDTGLFSFTTQRIKADAPPGDYKATDTQLALGPGLIGPSTGFGLGYAASRRVIPSLYFGLDRVNLDGEVEIDGDSTDTQERTLLQFELRPFLELALLPDSSFVPYAVLGLSYVRRSIELNDGGADSENTGVGPVLGLGAHAFAAPRVSFDFSVTFRALFVDDEDKEDALEAAGLDDIRQREYAILLNLGASLWL